MTGEVLEVAKDMETRSYREPLGVVAAICPFSMFFDKTSLVECLLMLHRLPCHDSLMVPTNRCGYR